jgi:dTDP-glucose 4,6-dehydratase
VITQVLSGKKSIRLGALSPTRDFNYIDDTIKGFIAMAESDAAVGQVVNIGSGFEVSIGDAARLIAEELTEDVEIVLDEQRLRPERSEVERLLSDNSRAKRLLGWTPEYGGLDGFRRGIRKAIDWFSNPVNTVSYKFERYNI